MLVPINVYSQISLISLIAQLLLTILLSILLIYEQ